MMQPIAIYSYDKVQLISFYTWQHLMGHCKPLFAVCRVMFWAVKSELCFNSEFEENYQGDNWLVMACYLFLMNAMADCICDITVNFTCTDFKSFTEETCC